MFPEYFYNLYIFFFAQGCECRGYFPVSASDATEICIDDKMDEVTWYTIDGNENKVRPWIVEPKRPMGCQYINTHNEALSRTLNCNTNVQIGDPSSIFYTTLYTTKDNQKEDCEAPQRVQNICTRQLLKAEAEILDGTRQPDEVQDGFVKGLCMMLAAMNAATSRFKVSTVMSHLMVCNGGTRFTFSHEFGNLLVSQLEATLDNKEIHVRLRTNMSGGKTVIWPDSSADDYIHRPDSPIFDVMCSYEMAMRFKKVCKTFKEMRNNAVSDNFDIDENVDGNIHRRRTQKFAFRDSHPGKEFCHLVELSLIVIPKIHLPKGKLCSIQKMGFKKCTTTDNVNLETTDKALLEYREDYAKMALLMFYPFRCINDLKLEGSYWKKYKNELSDYSNYIKRRKAETNETVTDGTQEGHSQGDTEKWPKGRFWEKGFEILQNIQDRTNLESHLKRARDKVTRDTECKQPDESDGKRRRLDDEDRLPDITEFCISKE